jgi:probable rRNA maturation factor
MPQMKARADDIGLSIGHAAWNAVEGLEDLARGVIAACAGQAARSAPKRFEVSLLFCDDAAIRALNKTWRAKDMATNVLSFPLPRGTQKTPPVMLGDIVIAYETTAAEAARDGKTLRSHTAHLIAHGFLHLLGYDHLTETDAEAMEDTERRVLKSLGIADPYLMLA